MDEFAIRLAARMRAALVAPTAKGGRAHRSAQRGRAEPTPQEKSVLFAMIRQGRGEEASTKAQDLVRRYPEHGLGWKTLGAILWQRGCADDALDAMRKSVELLPDDVEASSNLGMVLFKVGGLEEAETCLRKAIQIDPAFAPAHYHLGCTLNLKEQSLAAKASLEAAIKLKPDYAKAFNELASAHHLLGDDEAARACSRRALELKYDDVAAQSNLLFMLAHDASVSPEALFKEHCRVGEGFEGPLRHAWRRQANSPDPDRCLQVGFVSGDFRHHSVANFIEPLLVQLGRDPMLELHAYYTHTIDDFVTERLHKCVRHWNAVPFLSPEALAEKVRQDGIDILVDLSGHTSFHRLLTFARRPAPVQVSWIGYPGTTGMHAMDYYLTDAYFMPPGQFDAQFTEKLVYLPAVAPFQPYRKSPPVNRLPALESGSFTFGSFNRTSKLNAPTIALWTRLLRAVPTARMMLAGLPTDGVNARLVAKFAAEGIAADRLILHARGDMDAYLELHHKIDFCLDTQPYTGGTTTNHALWMGVPTLTTVGVTPASRQGAAILGSLGLDGFIAADADDFLRKGLYWVEHPDELAAVRAGMRDRWRHSRQRQPEVISFALQRALRHMWRRWCAGQAAETFEIPAEPVS